MRSFCSVRQDRGLGNRSRLRQYEANATSIARPAPQGAVLRCLADLVDLVEDSCGPGRDRVLMASSVIACDRSGLLLILLVSKTGSRKAPGLFDLHCKRPLQFVVAGLMP